MPIDPTVYNHVTQLKLKLTPYAQANLGESTTWDSVNYHIIDIPTESLEAGVYDITDSEQLYPETTYNSEVIEAVDSFNQNIPLASITIPSSFRMHRDYPAFSIFSPGNDSAEHEYTFSFSKPVDWQEVFTDIQNHPIVPRDINTAKPLLNSTFLDRHSYAFEHLVDYSDPNLFEPSTVQDGIFKHIEYSDTNSDFFKYYYGTTLDGYKNILRNGRRTLIGFDTFNKKIGIHEISATLTYDGVTVNSSPNWGSSTSRTTLGEDIALQTNIIDNGYTITGNETESIKDFRTSDLVLGVYGLENSGSGSVWVGINTKEWRENDNDAVGHLYIQSKAKSRQNTESLSYIGGSFYTFAIPRIEAYIQQNVDISTYTPVNINTAINSPYMSSISFRNNGMTGYMSIKFDISTRKERPFLPLVNENYDANKDVIGTTGIKTFSCLNNYIAPLDSSEQTDLIRSTQRQTSFIMETYVDGVDKPVPFDTYNGALNPYTSIPNSWKVIGFSPTYNSNSSSIAVKEYTLDSDTDQYTIDQDVYSAQSHNIGNLTTDLLDNANRYILTWPSGDFKTKDTDTGGMINGLVPGKYYAFRAIAANFCGTRVQPIVIKTADPFERTYGSHFFNPNDLSNPEFGIDPSTADNESLSWNIPLNSELHVYGGEMRSTTEVHDIISDIGYVSNNSGWEAASVNSHISIKSPSMSDFENCQSYIENSRNTVANSFIFDESGTYIIKVYSNTCRLVNTGLVEGNVKCHTYNITTTTQNTLNVITDVAVLTAYDTSTLNGHYASTGAYNIVATGFKHWTGSAEPANATPSTYNTDSNHFVSDNDMTTTPFYRTGMNNLQTNTEYKVRAFAVSDDVNIGIIYGDIVTYRTSSPVTATVNFASITRTTAQITLLD